MVEITNDSFMNLSSSMLDEIQHNIENIIRDFDVPDENKQEVIKQINFVYTRTKYLSITDELTGIPNRRHFETEYEKEYSRSIRYKSKLTLVIFDIDKFKKINDEYGHICGDYVLQQIANAALQTFRKTDSVYRIGGEEFAVILPETSIEQSKIPLERFRKTVETLYLQHYNQQINVTVSIGACELTNDIKSKTELFEKADEALYKAKNSGRNRIEFSSLS